MTKIYLITKNVVGPAGHGEPEDLYFALAKTVREQFDLGDPLPAFLSFDEAEAKRKEFDKCNFYKVIGLPVGRSNPRSATMNIDEAVIRACEEPTLLDALVRICIWESERSIHQARFNFGSGSNEAGWDTCFRVCLSRVMNSYKIQLGKQP